MAAGAACKLRMYDETSIKVKNYPNASVYMMEGKNLTLFELIYSGAASAVKTEISPPNAIFNGNTTPVKLSVVSNSVQDGVAGTGILTARIIGIGETVAGNTTYSLTYEDITMNGLTAVSTTKLWKRVFHIYALSWGTGKDADGTILVQNIAKTATYLTIGTGANDSDGSAIFIPANWNVTFQHINIDLTTFTSENSAAHVIIDKEDFDGESTDNDFETLYNKNASHQGGPCDQDLNKDTLDADAGAKITFNEIQTNGAESFLTKIQLLTYENLGDYS